MKLIVKILLFVFTVLITNVNVANAAISFSTIQTTTDFSIHNNEVIKVFLKGVENDLSKCCQNEIVLVDCRKRAINYRETATKGGSWAKTSGILSGAVKGKGNYGLGSGTYDEAMQAGRSWVGEGFTISKYGSSWISSNGLRQFRPPSFKPKLNIEQANFQWRNVNKGAWQSNGHLDIIKP